MRNVILLLVTPIVYGIGYLYGFISGLVIYNVVWWKVARSNEDVYKFIIFARENSPELIQKYNDAIGRVLKLHQTHNFDSVTGQAKNVVLMHIKSDMDFIKWDW